MGKTTKLLLVILGILILIELWLGWRYFSLSKLQKLSTVRIPTAQIPSEEPKPTFTPKPTETPKPADVVLPDIVYKIPPFPANITIHTPGYWPNIPWGEKEGESNSVHYHAWAGTFEGVKGVDSQNNVHVLVDLDIGPGQNIKEAVLPAGSYKTIFEIVRTQQGQSEIFSTTNPQEVLAVLSLPNWWKPHNDEPILIGLNSRDGRIQIDALRLSMQKW